MKTTKNLLKPFGLDFLEELDTEALQRTNGGSSTARPGPCAVKRTIGTLAPSHVAKAGNPVLDQ